MAWGYFDHPPAIALLIKAGTVLFDAELGVRFFIILSSVLSMYLAYKIVGVKDLKFFFLLTFSVLLVHVGGFFAAPDIPLILSSGLFLYIWKYFIEKQNITNTMLLGFAMACMAYSKYQGAVVVLFAILPLWRLWSRPAFLLSGFIALLLFLPHLYWQYVHDFPTFRFHLMDRAMGKNGWDTPFNYVLGQFLIFGPLISFLLFHGAIYYKAKTAYERSLKFCLWGILGFFMLTAFRGRVEPNWTAPVFFPLIYFGYHYLKSHPNLRKWSIRLAIPSIVIIIAFRVLLMHNFLPDGLSSRDEFHGWKQWATELSEFAGARPVIFKDSYQKAAKYQYYAGKLGFSSNSVNYKGNQYDLLTQYEEALQGQSVMFYDTDWWPADTFVDIGHHRLQSVAYVPNFRSYNRARIKVLSDDLQFAPSESKKIRFQLVNPTEQTISFVAEEPVKIGYYIYKYRNVVTYDERIYLNEDYNLAPGETMELVMQVTAPEEKGDYKIRFAISIGYSPGRNCNFYPLQVK